MEHNMDWLDQWFIAHRGYHSNKYPENSLGAFRRAITEGFAIELDVHILKDNKIIVFHDDNLERLTGYNKEIEECNYDEIKDLTLLQTNERIPLLDTVLHLVDGKVPLMIELKNRGPVGRLEREVYKLLKSYNGKFVIQSFNPYSLKWFYDKAPKIIRGQLSGSFKNEDMSFVEKLLLINLLLNTISKPHFINYEIQILCSMAIRMQKIIGKPVLGWTARNPQEFKDAKKKCINVLFEGFNPKDEKLKLFIK